MTLEPPPNLRELNSVDFSGLYLPISRCGTGTRRQPGLRPGIALLGITRTRPEGRVFL